MPFDGRKPQNWSQTDDRATNVEGWTVSGWDDEAAEAAAGGALTLSVSPNPSRGEGTVTLALPQPGEVAVALYDALGRRVAVLHEGALRAGSHAFALDGLTLPAGLYLVRATVEREGAAGTGRGVRAFTRSVTLLR